MNKSPRLSHFIWITLPCPQTEIDADLTTAKAEILRLLSEITTETNGQ